MYRKILIALEGKESDEAVVAHVRNLAVRTGAAITLLRVVGVADDGGGGLGKQLQLEPGSSGRRRKALAEACLSELSLPLRRDGLQVETALVIGTRSDADEIVAYAARQGHDLIAMASGSGAWYKRWIGADTADGVRRKAAVPTLFVGDSVQQAPLAREAPQQHPVMAVLGSAHL